MREFFEVIFGGAMADDRRLAIFTLPDRRTRHFSSLGAAALWTEKEADTKDVYFGVGLAARNHGKRNDSDDIGALGGFWADIDVAAPHRNGKPLPASVDEAMALLAGLPLQPSLVVDSGHGLHAYWLFKEPWVFGSDAERDRAAKLAKGWHGHVCDVAEARGWRIENLGDLARVLRVPGTFNRKGGEPVPVRVLEERPDRRFNPADFEPFKAARATAPATVPDLGKIVLRAGAEPPAGKFSSLLMASPAFTQTWNRQRPDLEDQSQSAYDQSLANIAALNDWSDQEIADLLIAARRKHGDKPEKAMRHDYIQRTLANARASASERVVDGVDLSGLKAAQSGGPRSLGQLITAYPQLRAPVIDGLLREGETMNVISAPKIGKALAVDTPILTDSGWTTMGEIRPGMKVHARDGTLTEVVAATDVMHDRPCYRITTKSGASVVADAEHLWCVRQRGHEAIVATKDLTAGRWGRRWQLPVAAPLVRPAASLPLDPWLLGYWLGNGTAREGAITCNALDAVAVEERVRRAEPTLAMEVYGLVRSLGIKASFGVQRASFHGEDCGPKIRISFAAGRIRSPFGLPRKTEALPLRMLSARSEGDAIVSVEPVPSVPVRCIQVAHPSGTFLAGDALMVTHNSWLVTDLALSVASGTPWLGMACVPGEVLILDNELHGETSANRIPQVAAARGIQIENVAERLYVDNLRGRLQDLLALGPYFKQFTPGRFKLVILDAFYRFLPMQADENDNGTMASLYNCLDSFAEHLKCCFVLVHHTSKGNQSQKELTDVGAGAGAQSRATDTHVILRRHEEGAAVVLEAAVRSWPPLPPRCLRWEFPVWMPGDDLDPARLKREGKREAKPAVPDDEPDVKAWTSDSFVEAFLTDVPKSLVRILDEAERAGLSSRRARRFLDLAEEEGRVHRCDLGQKRTGYSTEPGPAKPEAESASSRRQVVADLLRVEPDLTTSEVAQRCGVDDSYVRRIRRETEGSDAS